MKVFRSIVLGLVIGSAVEAQHSGNLEDIRVSRSGESGLRRPQPSCRICGQSSDSDDLPIYVGLCGQPLRPMFTGQR